MFVCLKFTLNMWSLWFIRLAVFCWRTGRTVENNAKFTSEVVRLHLAPPSAESTRLFLYPDSRFILPQIAKSFLGGIHIFHFITSNELNKVVLRLWPFVMPLREVLIITCYKTLNGIEHRFVPIAVSSQCWLPLASL